MTGRAREKKAAAIILTMLLGLALTSESYSDAGPAKKAASKGAKKAKTSASLKKNVPRVQKVIDKTDARLDGKYANTSYLSPTGGKQDDRTLAPYFYVAGGSPDEDLLPLKETSAFVQIAGVIAKVEIRQVFGNDGKEPIEAIYVFPASTRAAVHGMRMKIGKRTIEAKIDKRQEAKEIYDKAKADGKKASLLQQERPNVFTMRVANIMPKDKIEVSIDYSELIPHEKGVYEFVYPTVVGPRYGGGADPTKDEWISNPYMGEGHKEPYNFDIKVNLSTGVPVQDIKSPSHGIDVKYGSKSSAEVTLSKSGGGNKDFILNYRLSGKKIQSEVMLYEHGDENFFVLMMQPPNKPAASQVLPREYIFLLDVSGSMSGFPLNTAKSLMKKLLADLNAGDYFNIVAFAGASWVMSKKSVQATPKNINDAFKKVSSLAGGGGTELLEGLKSAYGVPMPADKKISRSVVVITDGYVGVEAKAFKYIRDRLSEANLFAFGIGSGVNRGLIEGMARAGFGEPFVVLDPGKAKEKSDRFREYVLRPVLTDIEVKYKGFSAYDDAPRKVPDLMAERPLVLFGKYKGKAAGTISIKGSAGDGKFEKKIVIDAKNAKKKNLPIRALWARKWSEILEDRLSMLPGDKDVEKAITKLGLHYSLLTAFTSFVAVDKKKTNKSGKVTIVKQPLPLPEGVSNNAIGALMGQQIGTSYGSGGYGLKGTGAGGGGTASYSMGLGMLKSAAPIPKVASPYGSSSGQVMGSISKSEVKKIFKKAVTGNKAVKALLKKCTCSGLKLNVFMKFDDDGKVENINVKVTGGDEECECEKTVVKAIRKALEKEFKDFKYPAAAGIQITYPLIISN